MKGQRAGIAPARSSVRTSVLVLLTWQLHPQADAESSAMALDPTLHQHRRSARIKGSSEPRSSEQESCGCLIEQLRPHTHSWVSNWDMVCGEGQKYDLLGVLSQPGPPKAMEVGAALGEGWELNENQIGRENWEEDTRWEMDNVKDCISQHLV